MSQAQSQPPPIPLHTVWFQVLKPTAVVMANGQPGIEIVAACETLAEATAHVAKTPGGVIAMTTVVFVNPNPAAILLKQ